MSHDSTCDCPGCFTNERVFMILNAIKELEGLSASINNGVPDFRFSQAALLIENCSQDLNTRLLELLVKCESGIPFIEGSEDFLDFFRCKK